MQGELLTAELLVVQTAGHEQEPGQESAMDVKLRQSLLRSHPVLESRPLSPDTLDLPLAVRTSPVTCTKVTMQLIRIMLQLWW